MSLYRLWWVFRWCPVQRWSTTRKIGKKRTSSSSLVNVALSQLQLWRSMIRAENLHLCLDIAMFTKFEAAAKYISYQSWGHVFYHGFMFIPGACQLMSADSRWTTRTLMMPRNVSTSYMAWILGWFRWNEGLWKGHNKHFKRIYSTCSCWSHQRSLMIIEQMVWFDT